MLSIEAGDDSLHFQKRVPQFTMKYTLQISVRIAIQWWSVIKFVELIEHRLICTSMVEYQLQAV